MKKYIKQLYLLLCCLVASGLFSTAIAAPGGGVGVLSEGSGLTLYNSIVWDNGSGTISVSGSNNLIGEDPLFASATEFLPLAESATVGAGDNTIWGNLTGIPLCDIAGVSHGNPLNIGAYENNVTYTVSLTANVSVYVGTQAIVNGTVLRAGTELKVTAVLPAGGKLDALTANGTKIPNGEPYYLTGNVAFDATFLPSREGYYATMKDGTGLFKVSNSIIYDNLDVFGNYNPDATTVTGNPRFNDRTTYTLQAKSTALGAGDGSKLTGISHDIAGTTIDATGAVDAGAYQSTSYTVTWNTTGGTLDVFKYEQNASDQWVEIPISSGEAVGPRTIIVRAKAESGYLLKELTYTG